MQDIARDAGLVFHRAELREPQPESDVIGIGPVETLGCKAIEDREETAIKEELGLAETKLAK